MSWMIGVLALVAAMGGCNLVGSDSGTSAADPAPDPATEFGDPYTIRTERTVVDASGTRSVPAPPRLDPAPADGPLPASTRLLVTLQHAGGCRTHEFDLQSHVSQEGAEASVWIEHDAQGDLCEAALTKDLEFTLPESVRSASSIRLLAPTRDPFTLR